jgi:hypothetical protein
MDILLSNGAVAAQVPLSHLGLGRVVSPILAQRAAGIAPRIGGRLSVFNTTLLAEILTTAHGHFVEQADLLARQKLQFAPQRSSQTPTVSLGGC